jgi:hypothetical protein
MIRQLNAENAEQAIRIINGTTLPETDSRRHQMLVAHLEGEPLSKLALEQGVSSSRGIQLVKRGFKMVTEELASRDRPDRLIRALHPSTRNALNADGFRTDKQVFDSPKRGIWSSDWMIQQLFRFDLDRPLPGRPLPELTDAQTDALLRLNGALEAIAWRDPRLGVCDLQILLRAARSSTPLTAAQLCSPYSGGDMMSRMVTLSDATVTMGGWPSRGRIAPLAINDPAPEGGGVVQYELTGVGRWVVGLLDRLLPDPGELSAEPALRTLTSTGLSILEMCALLRITLTPLTRRIPTCLGPGYGLMSNSDDATRGLKERWLITRAENVPYGGGLTRYRASMAGAALVEEIAEIIFPDRSLQIEEDPSNAPDI